MTNLRSVLSGKDPVAVLSMMDKNNTLGQLEPTLAELRMTIPNGYHHKDNLTHSLKVLQNAIDRETNGVDLILRTAALFHDIGKPATRKFGKKGLVTFDGHEHVGAHMVRKILRKHGYTKTEITEIAMIVAYHMRSHGFTTEKWTDSGVRRLIAEVGSKEAMERLIIIFYADITTKFDSKKSTLHASIEALVEAMEKVEKADARKALRPAVDGNEIMEIFGLTPGRELGTIMKFLNSDEGIILSKEEAIATVKNKFLG